MLIHGTVSLWLGFENTQPKKIKEMTGRKC